LWAFKLRKPFDASSIAAAVQRIAIEDECQRFTFRQTRRTVPMTFSIHVGTGKRSTQLVWQSNAKFEQFRALRMRRPPGHDACQLEKFLPGGTTFPR